MPFRRTAVLLAALALAAGCGGEARKSPPPPDPEQQVNAAADKVLHSDDARLVCSKLVTAGFLEEVYDGDVQACIDSPVHDPEDDRNGVEKIVDTQVQGTSAQISVRVPEGKLEGAGGHLEFAKEDGAWKLDRFGTDYLRSAFLTGVSATDTGALATPQVRQCFAEQVEQLPEAKLRRFSYQAIRDDKKHAMKLVLKLAGECPDALAIYVADAITEGMEENGRSKAYVRCMRRGIRDLVSVTGLGPRLLKGNINGAGKSALMGLVAGVDASCADKQ